jgi:hypothetical protein
MKDTIIHFGALSTIDGPKIWISCGAKSYFYTNVNEEITCIRCLALNLQAKLMNERWHYPPPEKTGLWWAL